MKLRVKFLNSEMTMAVVTTGWLWWAASADVILRSRYSCDRACYSPPQDLCRLHFSWFYAESDVEVDWEVNHFLFTTRKDEFLLRKSLAEMMEQRRVRDRHWRRSWFGRGRLPRARLLTEKL